MIGILPAAGTALLVGAAILHSALGEKLVLRPLASVELPSLMGRRRAMLRTVRVTWHLVSVAWIGLGALLVTSTGGLGSPTRTIAGVALVTALVIGIASRGRHPAWIAFFAASTCAWLS